MTEEKTKQERRDEVLTLIAGASGLSEEACMELLAKGWSYQEVLQQPARWISPSARTRYRELPVYIGEGPERIAVGKATLTRDGFVTINLDDKSAIDHITKITDGNYSIGEFGE